MPPRILLLAGLLAACGGAASPPAVPAPDRADDACVLRGGGASVSAVSPPRAVAAAADTALLNPARARTPIGLSCTGLPVARTAASWTADTSGRDWTLVVPSAAALASTWRGRPRAVLALRLAGATSYVPLDERRLVVSFTAPQDTVPGLFADPALAADADPADSLGLRPLPPPADLRDAVDANVDIVITADPAVADYAARRGGYAAHLLPWSRTYVLVLPGPSEPVGLAMMDSVAFREGLARDAVRTWARGAEGPGWWDATACERAAVPPPPVTATVVYPAGDPVARALAERVVAMTAAGGVTRGVADGQLGLAIARGLGTAFVLPVPSAPLVPCREVAAWPAAARVVPLIETRLTALVRAGTPPLRVDRDGGILPEVTR